MPRVSKKLVTKQIRVPKTVGRGRSAAPPAGAPTAAAPSTAPPAAAPPGTTPPAPRDPNLPAAQETAKAALERSPRHGELVDVKVPSGAPIRAWIVYPERKDKAGVVI